MMFTLVNSTYVQYVYVSYARREVSLKQIIALDGYIIQRTLFRKLHGVGMCNILLVAAREIALGNDTAFGLVLNW